MTKHPNQPIEYDDNGVVRFKENKIVSFMLTAGRNGSRFDMNMLAEMDFPIEDRIQFAQLIGYSVSGFGDLSYVSTDLARRMDRKAEKLPPKERGGKG